MTVSKTTRWHQRGYWLLPLVLAVVQGAFTLHSLPQLRYEELAESVRNPFWLQHRTVYDGISSNLGWYATVLGVYRAFGFSLYAAKAIRVVLWLASLLALASILRRFFPPSRAWVPLVLIGLSPTFLFFNTLQTSYGLDIQYFPIVLSLALGLDSASPRGLLARQALTGAISMWAWMSYPTFLCYLPALVGVQVLQLRRRRTLMPGSRSGWWMAAVAFAAPLVIALGSLKDPRLALFDPAVHSGLFRGAGTLSLRPRNAASNLFHTAVDLFDHANSYYFEAARVDFSGWPAVLVVGMMAGFSLAGCLWRTPERRAHLFAWSVAAIAIVSLSLALDPSGLPGIRRATPLLAAIYAIATIVWYQARSQASLRRSARLAVTGGILALVAHHVWALPANYQQLAEPSAHRYEEFFTAGATPAASLRAFVSDVERGELRLTCPTERPQCRYAEIYAAIAGACEWNRLSCYGIQGFDAARGEFVSIETGLWESHRWPH